MKRTFTFVCLLIALTSSLSGLDLSVGLGWDIGFIFTSLDTNIPEPYNTEAKNQVASTSLKRHALYGFIALKYFEANLGWRYMGFSYAESGVKYNESDSFFTFGLNVKYPFLLAPSTHISPIIGFDYSLFIAGELEEEDRYSVKMYRDDLTDRNYMDRWALNMGALLEANIISHVVMRVGLNYTILFNSELQKDLIRLFDQALYRFKIFQSGPKIVMGVGYKF
jgi:hypothetical protein